jgi:hypothetical protein
MSKPAQDSFVELWAAKGKAAGVALPRARHARWSPNQRTHQPLQLLAEQVETRLSVLTAIRYGRMAVSPFAYYRGPLPMAAERNVARAQAKDQIKARAK